ncbi:hypothetical protein [Macrococcus lamae]|uniref:YtxH domain-containing protein n=1 Tax=Macrococcus lamae TaxID=198484 RepID=A0A4R6BTD2_9STAP|nr:hypothetical protein [Macrococcus lamae]TDM07676.1 hypothetical protein ERX29_08005 [Macrococcus lamae]
MAKQAGLLRAALVIGGTAAAAYFSKKENLDRVLNKVQKSNIDSPGVKPTLAEKVKKTVADTVKSDNSINNERFPKTQRDTHEQVATFDDEGGGGVNNIHTVTDRDLLK